MNEETPQQNLTQGIRSRPVVQGISKKTVYIGIVIIVLIVAGLGALFVRSQIQLSKIQKEIKQQQDDPTAKAREESKQLIDEVGALMLLPKDEQPTIATVSDLEKLKDQPFFANAELGDKVLIFTKAKKAILYRPGERKVIELAPLNVGSEINP